MKVTVDVKNAQATEETRRGDMVAKGMMEVHTAHAASWGTMHWLWLICLYFFFRQAPKGRN